MNLATQHVNISNIEHQHKPHFQQNISLKKEIAELVFLSSFCILVFGWFQFSMVVYTSTNPSPK